MIIILFANMTYLWRQCDQSIVVENLQLFLSLGRMDDLFTGHKIFSNIINAGSRLRSACHQRIFA